mgnify:CR=1 FL=1
MRKTIIFPLLIIVIIAIAVIGVQTFVQSGKISGTLRVSTTTSLYATGLLEKLAEEFRKQYPDVVVQFIAVGTGRALRLVANGDVDMTFVHAPSLEQKYINNGLLVDGRIIAYNYFIIVGPRGDPANIKGLTSPIEAFKKIYEAGVKGKALFISRGDNSGTHVRELAIWRRAGLNPKGQKWYIESGTGMSKTLLIANEKKAYTLSDIGTFLKLKGEGVLNELEILVGKGEELINIYSAYIANPQKYKVNYKLAKLFLEFVTSDKGQEIINSYGKDKFSQPLFYPAKGKEPELKVYWRKLVEY